MEKQTLPNATLILVMGILSILGACCYGVPGIICAIVAIILATKATKLYNESPEDYTGIGNVKAGKIMAIIGVVISIIFIGMIIWTINTIGLDALQDPELMQQRLEEMQGR